MTMIRTAIALCMLTAVASADEKPPAPPAPSPPTPPTTLVVHVPPQATKAGAPIELVAQIDAPFSEALTARWRVVGESAWQDAAFERSSAGGWYATLPVAVPPGVEYFIRGRDTAGTEIAHFASERTPHVVRVVPSVNDRLEAADRERLHGRLNDLSVDVTGHDFGNRYKLADRWLRGEIAYTRQLLRQIYSASFGFGSIQGTTPRTQMLDGGEVDHGMRYGFGEVRLRVSPRLFVDVRGTAGASHDGFDGGVKGVITFGRPWRSSVSVGGEFLGDLGGTAFVRLQWDTAPPLVMGASIVRTDLPGVFIDPAGLYIGYDVALRVVERVAVKAQVTYGARDGSAHLGGGLGTAVDF
jgi:hypothetical protein